MQLHPTIWNRVTLTCAHCRSPFVVPASEAHSRRWCSHACYNAYRTAHWDENFWLHVATTATDECWLWTGVVLPNGYGQVTVFKRSRKTHRIAWELKNGPIPPGLHVIHLCDERYAPGDITYRRCCNPAHLTLGTHAENMARRKETGRTAQGDRHGSRCHPERRPRGQGHFAVTHPEKLPRGTAHCNAKLDEEKVIEILMLLKGRNTTMRAIAELYGVKPPAIGKISRGLTWKHIKRE